MKTINDVSEDEIDHFYTTHWHSRPAKSMKYQRGELVTPKDTPRKGEKEYIFVTSIRWCNGARSYGGYMLLNPRTGKLISATNIISLDHPEKNERI